MKVSSLAVYHIWKNFMKTISTKCASETGSIPLPNFDEYRQDKNIDNAFTKFFWKLDILKEDYQNSSKNLTSFLIWISVILMEIVMKSTWELELVTSS